MSEISRIVKCLIPALQTFFPYPRQHRFVTMATRCGGGLMAGTLRLMSLKLHSHFILQIRSGGHRTRTRNGPNKLSQMTEIAKRLNAIIAQIIPFLSQEHQQQVAAAVERAKQVTMTELNAIVGNDRCSVLSAPDASCSSIRHVIRIAMTIDRRFSEPKLKSQRLSLGNVHCQELLQYSECIRFEILRIGVDYFQ
ncbi:transducin-like enhancer protein 3-A [Trichonephila clavipes]|nr:transducin-like enhancer protein 3-A [Trichonephila clavipes]